MPLATLEGVQIYWEGYGRGEPVLFISGVSGGTWSWQDQIEAFSPHFRVVTFDNMGAGRSSKPDRPYSIAEMADQAAAVLHAANERRAYVVGLSMGGMIAQELTLRHPHLVSALVLGSTHCGGEARIPPGKVVIERFADNGGLSPEQIIDKNLQFLVSPEFLKDAPPA
jgi:3-oxoadipate enol-lactonase